MDETKEELSADDRNNVEDFEATVAPVEDTETLGGVGDDAIDRPTVLVDYDTITEEDPLGFGQCGAVYPYGASYAIKIVPSDWKEEKKKAALQSLQNGIEVVRKLQHENGGHDNISKMVRWDLTPSKEYILYERHEADLHAYLLGKGKKLSRQEMINLLKDLCDGMLYSHCRKIVHRDLKPANLLISINPNDQTKTLKITDYGLARVIAAEMTEGTGSLRYMAPELYTPGTEDPSKRIRYDGEKSDLYSAGMVAFFIFTGTLPFGDIQKSKELSFKENVKSGHRPPVWHLHHMIGGLLGKAWSKNPGDRGDFHSLRSELKAYGDQGYPGWGGKYCCYSYKGARFHPISIMKKICLRKNTQPIPLKY